MRPLVLIAMSLILAMLGVGTYVVALNVAWDRAAYDSPAPRSGLICRRGNPGDQGPLRICP